MAAPRGEQEVRAALVTAAAALFELRAPSTVSVRQIAERARVNQGLVHHYFGSKDGLLRSVLEHLAERSAAEVADRPVGAIYAAGGATARQGRILARLLLDGVDIGEYKRDFPGVSALIERFRADGLAVDDARQRAAQVTALVLGWQLFEPFVTAASGFETTDETRTRTLNDAIARLLR